jgi:hypothetical protein
VSTADTVTVARADLERCYALAEIGRMAKNWADVTVAMGHESPLDTLRYLHPEPGTAGAWLCDFMTWAQTGACPEPLAGSLLTASAA